MQSDHDRDQGDECRGRRLWEGRDRVVPENEAAEAVRGVTGVAELDALEILKLEYGSAQLAQARRIYRGRVDRPVEGEVPIEKEVDIGLVLPVLLVAEPSSEIEVDEVGL